MDPLAPEYQPLIDSLSDPRFYDEGGPVERIQTHISHVFLTNGYAYKLLKPVDFGFLDFSTREGRYVECWNEVRLNRRLAADVYLGVVPVVPAPPGGELPFRLGGSGTPVDWMIRMRRLPDDATLEARLRAKTVSDPAPVLDGLVPFFRRACRVSAESASVWTDRVRVATIENLEVIDRLEGGENAPAGHPDQPQPAARLRSAQLQFLAEHERLLHRRVRSGWVIDGHGDLRAEHIYLTDPPVIMDCIAFNTRFREIDCLDEVCFLASDLDRLGHRQFAQLLLEQYRTAMNDPAPNSLAAFYKSYRSAVRSKVAVLRAEGQTGQGRLDSLREAVAHLQAALQEIAPEHQPRLVVVLGLSGAGKSTVAKALAEWIGAPHVRSDVIRKELFGLGPLERSDDPALYAPEATSRTYGEMTRRAQEWLARRVSAVMDATFLSRGARERAVACAARAGVPILFVECTCPDAIIRERIRQRTASGTDASDADLAIYEAQRSRFQPLDELPPQCRLTIDTRRPPLENARQIVSHWRVV